MRSNSRNAGRMRRPARVARLDIAIGRAAWPRNVVAAAKAFSGIKVARATRSMAGRRATPIARAVKAFYLG